MPQAGDDAPITFTRAAGRRIAEAVRKVEIGDRGGAGLTFKRPADDQRPRKAFRICTFSGEWGLDSEKTVTFAYQTSTPNTVLATNIFIPGIAGTSTMYCAVQRDGTAWFLTQVRWIEQDFVSFATLTTAALEFSRHRSIRLEATAASFSIAITTCATATTG